MLASHGGPRNSFGVGAGYIARATEPRRVTTLLNGLLGGVLAGVVTAAGVALVGEGPSLTARSLARYRGGDPSADRAAAVAAHVAYAGAAGLGLAAVELHVLDLWSGPVPFAAAVPVGVAWTAALAGLTVAWWAAVGESVDAGLLTRVFVSHLALGVLLGAWVGLTWGT